MAKTFFVFNNNAKNSHEVNDINDSDEKIINNETLTSVADYIRPANINFQLT